MDFGFLEFFEKVLVVALFGGEFFGKFYFVIVLKKKELGKFLF